MGIYDEAVEVPRRTMVLFFLIDTSGSMSGAKIGTVNAAIENVIPELKDLSESNADSQVKIAVLQLQRARRSGEFQVELPGRRRPYELRRSMHGAEQQAIAQRVHERCIRFLRPCNLPHV